MKKGGDKVSTWKLVELYWKAKSNDADDIFQTKRNLHHKYDKTIKRIHVTGKKKKTLQTNNGVEIYYSLIRTYFIEDLHSFYHEEESENRKAIIINGEINEDILMEREQLETPDFDQMTIGEYSNRFVYDRRAAVQYAERWWNDANPAYKYFDDNDCTNYISQCLRAGGAPMHGAPNRAKGWWYNNSNWSYSWSVANAFRWYLSGSNSGLKGEELSEPTQLLPGDVICYDFEGDDKWDHTTIVVTKDDANMPLVNAHTNNSRHRYWTYEDSAAWTPNCKYRFFRIGD